MTIQEANKMYQVAIEGISDSYKLIFYSVLLAVFVISMILVYIKNKKIEDWLLPVFFVVLIINVILFDYNVKKDNKAIIRNIAEWEERVGKETIGGLPIEKIELEDYLITKDKEIKDERKYILNERKNPKVIEIIYLENGMKTRETIEANVEKVKGLETPYIETQSLENNIPLDPDNVIYKKGFYNTTLYVPE